MANTNNKINNIYSIPVLTIDGQEQTLDEYRGQVMVIVNTASQCGFTPQYKDLQSIYETYREQGLVVLAFPANNFGGQEPGTHSEIKAFCKSMNVTFPVYGKLEAQGPNVHPLFSFLVANSPENESGDVRWNFEKFIVNRSGFVVGRFRSAVRPLAPEFIATIEKFLLASVPSQ